MQQRVGLRLVTARVLGADDDVEERLQVGQRLERQRDCGPTLRRHDAEAPTPLAEPDQRGEHAGARLERRVQRFVVLAVDAHQLVGSMLVDRAHLVGQALPAHG